MSASPPTDAECFKSYLESGDDSFLPYGMAGYPCFDEGRERAWYRLMRERGLEPTREAYAGFVIHTGDMMHGGG